ncbi:MAG: TolC family protein [Burkholderiaceae bacterium]|nr:TolC family protein [Burkholderiaceae bacterium]
MNFVLMAALPRACALACLAWATTGAPLPAGAQVPPPVLPATATALQVLADLPQVRAARAGIPLAQARQQRLEAGPHDWVAKAASHRRSERQGPRFMESEIGIEKALRWPGKFTADQQLGASEMTLGQLGYADAWHEAARGLLTDWFDTLRDLRNATLLEEQTRLTTRQLAITQRRVQAGEAAKLELLTTQAEEARLQAQATRARAQATLRLQSLLRRYPGLPDPGKGLAGDAGLAPPEPADLPSAEQGAAQILEDNHELELAEARAAQAQLQARRTALERQPDLTLGVRATRERGGQEQVLGVYVSLPLGGAGRRADAQAALAQADIAQEELARTRQRIQAEAWRTASELGQTRNTREQLHKALGQIQQSAHLQARAYELGESPLSDLLLARRNALEALLAADTATLDEMQAQARWLLDSHRLWTAPPSETGH